MSACLRFIFHVGRAGGDLPQLVQVHLPHCGLRGSAAGSQVRNLSLTSCVWVGRELEYDGFANVAFAILRSFSVVPKVGRFTFVSYKTHPRVHESVDGLADDLKHERKVALKVLKPELAAVVGAERFLAEIKTTANLQHPHILPLFDSGEADSFLFYVMPHVQGESLRERIDREKQLAVGDSLVITQKVASALDYAHGHGVVHRDIKPANILLSEQGEPLVADFGIALAVAQAGAGRITETGLSLGTPHYMSPEQATGDRDVDPRSDVYALGCVLYEMLAGQPPFSATTAQAVLVKILTADAPSITSERRTVPPNVGAALARSLEKLPADRFTSAAEFGAALGDESFTYQARTRTTVATALPEPVTVPTPVDAIG